MTSHYCPGKIGIAFVFSVPGAAECNAGRPVAGQTGENLEVALRHLHVGMPELFSSCHRYDYRITNAFAEPIARSLGHGKSEASKTAILDAGNIARVVRELEDCNVVVLSGKKAQLLGTCVSEPGRTIISVPHIGNAGLNSIVLPATMAAATSSTRRLRRIEKWSEMIRVALEPDAA